MFFEHDIILETPKLGTYYREYRLWWSKYFILDTYRYVTEASMDIKTTVHKIGWP